MYPLLPDSGADAFEQELLGRWEAEQLFEQVQAARAGATHHIIRGRAAPLVFTRVSRYHLDRWYEALAARASRRGTSPPLLHP